MKKIKCTLCGRSKARRKCKIYHDRLICSLCCADLRNPDCEDCQFDITNAVKSFKGVIAVGDPDDDMFQTADSFVAGLEQQIMATQNITLEEYFHAQEKFETAFSYMEKKEWQKAIRGFRECIMINKRHPQSYGNLGLCYAQLGRKADALAALDKALEIDPKYEPAMVNRAMIESLHEGEKLQQERFAPISVDYYKDYPAKKKSFIQSMYDNLLGR